MFDQKLNRNTWRAILDRYTWHHSIENSAKIQEAY